MIFEFGGEVGGLRRLVLGTPGCAVIGFPLALEGFAVAAAGPEFRFLQEDGVHAGINHPLDVTLLEVFQVVFRRYNVGDHPAVPDGVAVLLYLAFVQVPLAIPFSGEIVLVFTPGDAGHEMGRIALFLPGSQTVFQALATAVPVGGVASHAVHHHGIGPVVDVFIPAAGGLEGGFVRGVLLRPRRGAGGDQQGRTCNQDSSFHVSKIIKREDERKCFHPPST